MLFATLKLSADRSDDNSCLYALPLVSSEASLSDRTTKNSHTYNMAILQLLSEWSQQQQQQQQQQPLFAFIARCLQNGLRCKVLSNWLEFMESLFQRIESNEDLLSSKSSLYLESVSANYIHPFFPLHS